MNVMLQTYNYHRRRRYGGGGGGGGGLSTIRYFTIRKLQTDCMVVKVKFIVEQATKAKKWHRGTHLLPH